jgi:hypothetical protein
MSSLEQILKAYEGPDQFFLHNINAANHAIGGNPLMRSFAQNLSCQAL